jgi:hypothetical protein
LRKAGASPPSFRFLSPRSNRNGRRHIQTIAREKKKIYAKNGIILIKELYKR